MVKTVLLPQDKYLVNDGQIFKINGQKFKNMLIKFQIKSNHKKSKLLISLDA